MRNNMRMIFEFGESRRQGTWMPVDDVVMGGVSASHFRVTSDGLGVFEGTVSLERGGGFASVRSTSAPMDLSNFDGLEIRVRGDGKRYRLRLRTSTGFDGVGYQLTFWTEPGEWQSIRLPFARFESRLYGRPVPNAPPLDVGAISSFGWLIADGQAGPFRLEIAWVGAYTERSE